jgi:hypothetical protein
VHLFQLVGEVTGLADKAQEALPLFGRHARFSIRVNRQTGGFAKLIEQVFEGRLDFKATEPDSPFRVAVGLLVHIESHLDTTE